MRFVDILGLMDVVCNAINAIHRLYHEIDVCKHCVWALVKSDR